MITTRKSKRRDYDQQEYWNDRYTATLASNSNDDQTDEWYFSYSDISDVLELYLKKNSIRNLPILDIGCGLSKIFDELSNDSFLGPFVGIDYSTIVIDQCKKTESNYIYLVLDIMQKQKPRLPFESFGLILDKGTTDAILFTDKHLSTISNMYEHASSLLANNGLYILITLKTVDDTDWFENCLIPALLRGSISSKFIIHFHRCAIYTDGTENGPNIFVIVKYNCKSYELRSSTRNRTKQPSHSVTVKCH